MTTARAADVATELAPRLRRAVVMLTRTLRQADSEVSGVSMGQMSALGTLEVHGAMSLRRLAELERVQPPTMTRIVDRLVADGFATREADPTDRRAVVLAITDRGSVLMADSRQRRTQFLLQRLGTPTAGELDDLRTTVDVLERLLGEVP